MDSVFTPASGDSVSQDVVLQIEAAIVGGKIQPGERLPSERDLQAIFRTGRGVVREALGVLKQKGLVEVKKGAHGGAFVKKVDIADASEALALLFQQRAISLEYLIEFRESIDRTVTTLAITRGDEADKLILQQLSRQLVELAVYQKDPDLEAILELDRNLNLLLVKMTKNPVFEWVMRTIQLGVGSHDGVLYEHPYYRVRTALNWRNTADGIAAGEPLKALSYIGYHYVLLQWCIAEKNGDLADSIPASDGDPSLIGQGREGRK